MLATVSFELPSSAFNQMSPIEFEMKVKAQEIKEVSIGSDNRSVLFIHKGRDITVDLPRSYDLQGFLKQNNVKIISLREQTRKNSTLGGISSASRGGSILIGLLCIAGFFIFRRHFASTH
jgi:hypothetical protein